MTTTNWTARVPAADPPMDVGNSWNITHTLANSPAAFTSFVRFLSHLGRHSELPRDVREAVILSVAGRLGAAYEWGRHVPAALAAGISQEAIRSLRGGDVSGLEPLGATAAEYAVAVEARCVDDALWQRTAESFTTSQMVELTMYAAFYGLVARVADALQIPLDDDNGGLADP